MTKKRSSTSTTVPLGRELREHPRLKLMLQQAEGRLFSDDELRVLGNIFPSLQPRCHAGREYGALLPEVVARVVDEINGCYPMEDYNEVAVQKTDRDMSYTLAYAEHAMILNDPNWFDNKLLIWLKTMLRAFEFPDYLPEADIPEPLEKKLRALPPKARAIFHGYERVREEMRTRMAERNYELMEPFLRQINQTLMEDYVIVEGAEL